jgi:hypothetical protein
MRHLRLFAAAASLAFSIGAHAGVITFNSDPFAGTTALTTPGRQIVANELFVPTFITATDSFAFDPVVFGVSGTIAFANDVVGGLATTGLNVIVLETFDNDSNAATPFGAGAAADLIAARVTSSGAGFFVYFNSGLTAARLVYSPDLSDNSVDLKILARLQTLNGVSGAAAAAQLTTLTASNFSNGAPPTSVPEPLALWPVALGLLIAGRRWLRFQGQ